MCCSRRVSAAWPAASSSAPPSSSLWSKIDSNRPGQHIQLGNTKHRKSHLTHIQAQHVNSNWPCSCSNQFQDPGQSTVVPLVLVRQLAQIWHTIGRTSNAKKMSGKENDKDTASINDSPKRQIIATFTMNVKDPALPIFGNISFSLQFKRIGQMKFDDQFKANKRAESLQKFNKGAGLAIRIWSK